MRILTEEDRQRILTRVFKKQMQTGQPRAMVAMRLLSNERREAHRQALEDPRPDMINIINLMDQVVRDGSQGRIGSWLEMEQLLVRTSTPTLRLFNIGAVLNGQQQLMETSAIAEKLLPLIRFLEERLQPDQFLKLTLKPSSNLESAPS